MVIIILLMAFLSGVTGVNKFRLFIRGTALKLLKNLAFLKVFILM